MTRVDALRYYDEALKLVTPYNQAEIDDVRTRRLENQDADSFLHHYLYVVFNSGMKNEVAENMLREFYAAGFDLELVKHEGKKKAVKAALADYKHWWTALSTTRNKIGYLSVLPYMGPVTKYHLARNLGLDVAKPDRWLVRLAARFGFKTAEEMCAYIAEKRKERIGVVDLVLWRYARMEAKSPV